MSSTSDVQDAKMRITSPFFQLRDIIRTSFVSSPQSYDLISTFLSYGQILGATSVHYYFVDRCDDAQTLMSDCLSSHQGVALCVTYDVKLSEQQWQNVFGIHETTSRASKTASSFDHSTEILCILSGSRVVLSEHARSDEGAHLSIFDLENDGFEVLQDQLSLLNYFFLKSKTVFNGTLIHLPLRAVLNGQISTQTQVLENIKQQTHRYFNLTNSLIELLLTRTNINTIEFDYTKDFQLLTKFLSVEKRTLTTFYDARLTAQIIHLTLSRLINDINTRFVHIIKEIIRSHIYTVSQKIIRPPP